MPSRLSLPSERIKQLLRFVYTRRNCATKLFAGQGCVPIDDTHFGCFRLILEFPLRHR